MSENQDQLDLAKKAVTEMLGGEAPEKKDEKPEAKTDVVVDEKKEEKPAEAKADEQKPDGEQKEEEITPVIKIAGKAPEQKEEEKKAEEPEIDEAILLKVLSKKAGREITSMDDFLNPKKEETAEDKEKAKAKRDAEKIAYGLQQGIISEKKLTKYFADSKNKVELVFEEYWQTQSAEDKDLTKAQARVEFNEKHHLDSEEDSRNYKRGMKEIDALGTQILQNEYPEIFELERTYSSYENTLTTTKQKEQTILQKAPQYKKDVESALDEIKSIKVSRDKDEFEIEIDKSILNSYKNQMLESAYAEKQILNGWNKDEIKARFQGAAILENLSEVVFSAVDQALLKREKGLKGALPSKPFNAKSEDAETRSAIEKATEEIKKQLQGASQHQMATN